ncbi:MAG: hypothetical protein FJ252_01055 [Phycisphaerae bacterium]|nr:hypothetical protein [Phycisphaerae bacterium]
MRFISRKLWRAFHELDAFDDDNCRELMVRARSGTVRKVSWLMMQGIMAIAASVVPFLVVGDIALQNGIGPPVNDWLTAMGMRLQLGLNRVFTEWSTAGVGVMLILTFMTFAAGWFLTRDGLLWWRVRRLIRRCNLCLACNHSLVGGLVADGAVQCNECGNRTPLVLVMDSVRTGADGQPRFLPSGREHGVAVPPIFSRETRRRAVRVAIVVLGIPLVIWASWAGIRSIRMIPMRSDELHAVDLPSIWWACAKQGSSGPVAPLGPDRLQALLSPLSWLAASWRASCLPPAGSGRPLLVPFVPPRTDASGALAAVGEGDPIHQHNEMLRAGLLDVLRACKDAEMMGVMTSHDTAAMAVGWEWGTEQLRLIWGLALYTMDRALHEDDREAWIVAFDAALAIEARIAQLPSLHHREDAARLGVWTLARMGDVIERHPDPEMIAALAASVQAHAWRPDLAATIKANRRTAIGAVAWVCSDPSNLFPFFEKDRRRSFLMNQPGWHSIHDKVGSWWEVRTQIADYFDAVEAQQSTPMWLRQPVQYPSDPLAQAILDNDAFDAVAEVGARLTASMQIPGLAERCHDEAVAGMLALARWRHKRGTAPASAAEFVPDFAATVPMDPRTGKPMTVTDEQRPEGRVWVLRQGDDVLLRLPAP